VSDAVNRARPGVAVAAALGLLLAALPVVLTSPSVAQLADPLTLVLAACAIVSVLFASDWEGVVDVSPAFVCFILAGALVGPVAAFAVPVAAEVVTFAVRRYRRRALAVNLAATATPSLLAALVYGELVGTLHDGRPADLAVLALVAIGFLVLNYVTLRVLAVLLDGGSMRAALRPPRELLPPLALTVAVAVPVAVVFEQLGLAAGAFLVLIIVAFTYMYRLVRIASERTEQYAAMSWGVLSSLVRALDRRDGRTARHSAAVAGFARDIALECGMSQRDAELAHTAGLLHDIGRFALPDRVMERHGTLTQDDWESIHQHPEIGADLLRDLGVYGPVAEIVRAHHERIDGRGYPRRLKGDEIPEIARIVAVAEVYDTLTTQDTYRDRMTSFQAMTELRRVAGRQLDERFVEALASLLAGRGMDYRHAETADFDTELAIEGRIADSVALDSS
jgi:putative nucleotidyltransferase with HDIG domain